MQIHGSFQGKYCLFKFRRCFSFKDYIIIYCSSFRHHLKIYGILGEGCFGQVWKCEALNIDGNKGTTTVAVKTLKESASEKERKDLIAELNLMKMLDPHPNVVRLLGCCTLGTEKGKDNPRELKPVLCVNALC
jgi:serine/threonine protein kinase